MKIPNNRKGFRVPEPILPPALVSTIQPSHLEPLVYWNNKLKHSGITAYKVFENISRRSKLSSLQNLLNNRNFVNSDLNFYIDTFKSLSTDDEKCTLNNEVVEVLNKEEYTLYLKQTRQIRNLNSSQSKKVRSLVDKLSYYTQTRNFESKKTGKHHMKIAFITLTSPAGTTNDQMLSAFNHFLDYLQRTANCVYVWKKELGEENSKLHFHIAVNNFVPYYIVNWKWKRLLVSEGVSWPLNEKGKDTASHYRVELPHNAKQISHYIAKYMSKAYDLPGNCGYVYGNSRILTQLKETDLSEFEIDSNEIQALKKRFKSIKHDYTEHICCDLLKIKDIAPQLYSYFEKQYVSFSEQITLPQRFRYVDQNEYVTNSI